VVTPVVEGEDLLPYYSADGISSAKTKLANGKFIGATSGFAGTLDNWFGDSYFRPFQIPCLGDQLLITVRRTNNELGVYDFGDPEKDAAFDITYGRSEYNVANPPGEGEDRSQAISPAVGLIVYSGNTGF
jgi:hypothetical protein